MNDAVKVAGLCCSAVICVVALALGEMNFAYSAGGIFAGILGLPIVGNGIKKLVRP